MKELLKEAAKVLRYRYGLKDNNSLLERIDAALAAPEPDAMAIVRKIRSIEYHLTKSGTSYATHPLTDSEAAALIADFGKRVPKAMLEELERFYMNRGEGFPNVDENEIDYDEDIKILAKYGYRAE